MFKRLKTKVWLYLHSAIKSAIEEALENDSFNMQRQRWRLSRDEATQYAIAHIGFEKACNDRWALMDRALELVSPAGLILEFGVWKGASIKYLATRLFPRVVYGFDSFEGLPDAWSLGLPKGTFKVESLPEVPANVELIKGMFDATSTEFIAKHPDPISLLHIDCDIYPSARFVFDTYGSRIVAGTVILFDDYMNYPTWTQGEFKAFLEWCQALGAKYQYIGFVPKRTGNAFEGQQVAVQITQVGH